MSARIKMNSGDYAHKYSRDYAVDLGSKRVTRREVLKFVVGRSASSDLVIFSTEVSDKHCEIACSGDDWVLHNVSPDGTSIVGSQVARDEPVELENETILRIGNVYIRCETKIEPNDPPLRVLKLHILMGGRCQLVAGSEGDPTDGLENEQDDAIEVDSSDGMDAAAVENPTEVINGLINNMATVNQQLEEELRETKEALKMALSEESNWKGIAAEFQLQIDNGAFMLNEQMENELQCSICNELIIEAVTLNCSHTYCAYCLREWRKTGVFCPMCREHITYQCKTRMIDSLIDKVIEHLSEDAQQRRKELCEKRRGGHR